MEEVGALFAYQGELFGTLDTSTLGCSEYSYILGHYRSAMVKSRHLVLAGKPPTTG